MRTTRAAGFTLFEMLVVIAVLSVVSTIAVTSFSSVTSYYRTTSLRMDLAVRADAVFSEIQQDFARLAPSSRDGVAIWGERRLEETQRYGRVPLENDFFVLPIASQDPKTGLNERIAVMYSIDRSGPLPTLKRTLGPADARPPAGAQLDVATGVLSMAVEYTDGKGAWQRTWAGPGHPAAVRVSLTLRDENRPMEQVARVAEFTVNVR
jgi:prepilin-type N-terminal cleavage/methylation domain-containing protein